MSPVGVETATLESVVRAVAELLEPRRSGRAGGRTCRARYSTTCCRVRSYVAQAGLARVLEPAAAVAASECAAVQEP